jgi:hypothetical protein
MDVDAVHQGSGDELLVIRHRGRLFPESLVGFTGMRTEIVIISNVYWNYMP